MPEISELQPEGHSKIRGNFREQIRPFGVSLTVQKKCLHLLGLKGSQGKKKKKFIYITWSTEIMRNVNLALCLPGGFSSPQRGAIFTSAGYLIKKNMWLDWNHRARKNQPNLSKVMSFVTLQT